MNSTERDLLASVYLDGEATPDEVALVERDADLMARVETFRAVQAQVAPRGTTTVVKSGAKEQHLANALELFESQPPTASDNRATNSNVVDLTNRRRDSQVETRRRTGERLSLLTTAAGAMVLLVGGVFLASRLGEGSANTESAAIELTTDDAGSAAEVSSDEAGANAFDGTANAIDAPLEEPAAEMEEAVGEAMENEAADSEAALSTGPAADGDADTAADTVGQTVAGDAEEEFAEDSADEEEAPPSTTTTLPDIRRESLPDGGFFPQEPVVIYPDQPLGQDLIDDLTLAWRNPESSMCGATFTHSDNSLLIAYLPVEITAGPGGQSQIQEALYYTLGNDVEVILVDRETCEPT